uniref:Uncharacterized protein n=1 Tax=Oryza brachyantha TaxID=4533 RepID=J3MKL9_ORYBR
MFRLAADLIHALHWLLTTRYALGIFLFIMAGSQGNGVANNRLVSLGSTISRYFHRILNLVAMLAADIVKPADPNFEMV